MSAGVVIEKAMVEDRDALEALIGRCYAKVYPGWYEADILENALPAMLRIDPKLLESGRYFKAIDDGTIVGCGGWSHATPGTGDKVGATGHVRHFATEPGQMRTGVGSAILERCVSDALDSGMTRLQCFSSLPAEAFYERHGFERVQEVTVMLGESIPFPAILMQRVLV
ncbi:GNAT family N-acetyltransferase [Notoacmeibacter ruber]|uniref:N-acetyltransferase n=1 Tax=Notoacmeibacter ruber TaxID=2670375 RepID=A0A3L7JBY6_9HYPH|nr:GNAT family N-acetyltransferase [Notoacmeibacter ruber]RLQ87051.1 N-acetyltransferase [Notoacmeibacter ruber]